MELSGTVLPGLEPCRRSQLLSVSQVCRRIWQATGQTGHSGEAVLVKLSGTVLHKTRTPPSCPTLLCISSLPMYMASYWTNWLHWESRPNRGVSCISDPSP
ncbi:uncharacterized protein [Danio rerio]|uniref:Uncharacterized protein n=1 Tax=Danio rerio TaxID=7955 RepID=A0AC58IT80_DANRE